MSQVFHCPARLVVVLSGASGVGKNKIQGGLENCSFSVAAGKPHTLTSATTRPLREKDGEVAGVHYHPMSDDEFCRRHERGEFAEAVKNPNGYRYGLLASEFERAPEGSLAIVHLNIDGGLVLKQRYPQVLLIWVVADRNKERNLLLCKYRMTQRGDKSQDIAKRLEIAKDEMARMDHLLIHGRYDHVIVNADGKLADATHETHRLIEAALTLSCVTS